MNLELNTLRDFRGRGFLTMTVLHLYEPSIEHCRRCESIWSFRPDDMLDQHKTNADDIVGSTWLNRPRIEHCQRSTVLQLLRVYAPTYVAASPSEIFSFWQLCQCSVLVDGSCLCSIVVDVKKSSVSDSSGNVQGWVDGLCTCSTAVVVRELQFLTPLTMLDVEWMVHVIQHRLRQKIHYLTAPTVFSDGLMVHVHAAPSS